MFKELSLESSLLSGYEFPVALVVEVTKQGIVLSKQRYLKALGDVVNQTIRCASIEMYAHTGSFLDPHLRFGSDGPVGVDLLYNFRVEKHYFFETVEAIKDGKLRINMNNPQTVDVARVLMEKIMRRESLSYKRLRSHEQGLILEPYMTHMLQKAGKGKRTVLQNVELLDREGVLRCLVDGETIEYKPTPAPVMEVDILMITEIATLPNILKDLENHGFRHEKAPF